MCGCLVSHLDVLICSFSLCETHFSQLNSSRKEVVEESIISFVRRFLIDLTTSRGVSIGRSAAVAGRGGSRMTPRNESVDIVIFHRSELEEPDALFKTSQDPQAFSWIDASPTGKNTAWPNYVSEV